MNSFALQAKFTSYAPRGAANDRSCVLAAQRICLPFSPASRSRRTRVQNAVWAAAAVEVEDDVDDLDSDEGVAAQAPEEAQTAESSTKSLDFALNFLWMDKNIAVAVDQVFAKDQRAPVTEYFFWPRKDAWEELKVSLEAKPWIDTRDKILMLNRTTEVINFWQTDGDKPSLEQAQKTFPDCIFKGS